MEVGATAQQVTVTGEAPLVNTQDSTLGGTVNETKMAQLQLKQSKLCGPEFIAAGRQPGQEQQQRDNSSGS